MSASPSYVLTSPNIKRQSKFLQRHTAGRISYNQ